MEITKNQIEQIRSSAKKAIESVERLERISGERAPATTWIKDILMDLDDIEGAHSNDGHNKIKPINYMDLMVQWCFKMAVWVMKNNDKSQGLFETMCELLEVMSSEDFFYGEDWKSAFGFTLDR